jgi:hypothetical protein
MLNSLLIRNFRIFKELKIPKLGVVNLIVGKNNAGKSCLLEAVQIYASRANPGVLSDIIQARDEDWEQSVKRNGRPAQEVEDPIRHLFHGYHLPDVGDAGIELGPLDDDKRRIHIKLGAYQVTVDKEGRRLRKPVSREEIKEELVDIKIAIEVQGGDEKRYLFTLAEDPLQLFGRELYVPTLKEPSFNIQNVPSKNMDNTNISTLWDNISLTELESEVIRCLKIVDPKVSGVALVGDPESAKFRKGGRIPIVRCKDSDERIPIKNMGDGMTRLFHIILALVSARDGFLLIDEFENGLYWGIHKEVWETVFRLAQQLKVQVFATTHSQDCVRAFHRVWSEDIDRGSFHRLEIDHAMMTKIVNYTPESLSDALETDVEVR